MVQPASFTSLPTPHQLCPRKHLSNCCQIRYNKHVSNILAFPKKEEIKVVAKRARLYDIVAFLVVVVVLVLDQWTKALVVEHLSPPECMPPIPLLGQFLVVYYIWN